MTAVPNLRRGGEDAEEASNAGGGKFAKVNYFSLDENKTTVVRFLTDSPDWFYVKQHPSVPTKNKPADFKGNWPQSMPAVCRHDDAFTGMYDDCYVCDTPVMSPHDATKALKPAIRVWALAVEREPVVEEGVVKGYRTVMEEVPARNEKGEVIEGKTVKQMKVLVVNMGMKNFFSGLQGIYGLFNSVCSRDMMIRRTGTGIATDYQIIPLDEIPTLKGPIFKVDKQTQVRTEIAPATEAWAKFEKAVADQNINLAEIIANRASDEYYARFFDPSKVSAPTQSGTAPATGQSAQATQQAAAAPAAPSADVVDQDRLAAMAARVSGTGANAGATPPAPAPEAPAAAPAPVPAATGPVNYDE